ncbi:MAG: hypothetical protein H6737_17940 [Alphaproteobacteria bacterium]|nr:hypothetical protein [Alphaproteobacteria bacterium]
MLAMLIALTAHASGTDVVSQRPDFSHAGVTVDAGSHAVVGAKVQPVRAVPRVAAAPVRPATPSPQPPVLTLPAWIPLQRPAQISNGMVRSR